MRRIKEPKSVIESQRKWKANNARKPKTRHPSRMKDFRQMAPEAAEKARVRSPDLIVESREGRQLNIANRDGLVIKGMQHHKFTLDLARHLGKFRFNTVQLVPIKQVVANNAIEAPRWVQRYFKRPSLHALSSYLHCLGYEEKGMFLSETDKNYCASLLRANPKITLEMVNDATQELESAFNSWPDNSKKSRWSRGFSFGDGTNFVVLGLAKDKARLKVCLVDA